jgi:hypothetical protein
MHFTAQNGRNFEQATYTSFLELKHGEILILSTRNPLVASRSSGGAFNNYTTFLPHFICLNHFLLSSLSFSSSES